VSPSNHTVPADEVAQLRDRIMENLAPVPTFAKAIGKSIRAVQRMAKSGQIEVIKYGQTPYVRLGSVRKAGADNRGACGSQSEREAWWTAKSTDA
jgi:hypothetical protein